MSIVAAVLHALPGRDGTSVVAPSSVAQARQRVGASPIEWLFRRTGQEWSHHSARKLAWKGLALYGVDGSTLRVADSDDDRDRFGTASAGPRGQSGYPLMRLVTLMALRTHLLAAARFGPYAVSEHELSQLLWHDIPADSPAAP
jgi:hypothetical protein